MAGAVGFAATLRTMALPAALLATMLTPAARAASEPPVSAFAELPPIHDVQLSRDGTRAVMLRAIGDTYHAVLADFAAGRMRPLLAADPERFLFNWCRWANADRIVCSIRQYGTMRAGQMPGYVRRYRDGRTTFTRLIAVNADGSGQLQLVPEAVTRPGEDLEWNMPDQDDVISWLDDDPEHILIQLRREASEPSVYRLNIYDNRMDRVRRHHDSVLRWFADHDGELRLAAGYRGTAPVAFSVQNNRAAELDLSHLGGVRPPEVAAFAADGASVYLFANAGRRTRGLYRADVATGRIAETLLLDQEHDVDGRLVLHPRTRLPLVLDYRRERQASWWFDRTLADELDAVRAKLPGGPAHLRLVSLDGAGERLVFATSGNGTLPRHYLYDRRRPDHLVLLAQAYPNLQRAIEPATVSYPARDGQRIPAYLTLPANRAADVPVPAVLLPHGGPWARDDGSFDYWVQLLASRGYAVLQPNFRGSTGYGDDFLAAGFEQWGLAMQNDLVDGLDWLIENGIADPERVCVVGGSYGGYAALVASYQIPGRIRCAVAFAGVTDLDALTRRWWDYLLGELSIARVQDGRARVEASPLEQVQRIGVPLLIVHGDLDRNVMIEQSRALVDALESAGKPYRYVEQHNGDHHLSRYSHRLEFLEAMDAFLTMHLDTPAVKQLSDSAVGTPPG